MTGAGRPLTASSTAGALGQVAVLGAAAAIAWASGAVRAGGVEALVFAAAICLVGIVGGWMAARWQGRSPAARVAGSLAVVALRIFPALTALGWLQTPGAAGLREAGAGELLLAFYLAVLATDVFLNIMGTLPGRPGPGRGPSN